MLYDSLPKPTKPGPIPFSKFDFDGRCEFWDEDCNSSHYAATSYLTEKFFKYYRGEINAAKLNEELEKAMIYCYRQGFARGCRAGFDDLQLALKLDIDDNISVDAWHRMTEAIPFYKDNTKEVKEWRYRYL